MNILFWMFIGFDNHSTSEHLLTAIIEQLCKNGNNVHIIQKYTGGKQNSIPEKLLKYNVTTDVIPFKAAPKSNFVKRYISELKYIDACKKNFTSSYDAVFIQSTTVAGFAVKAIRKKMPNAIITFNVQDIFPYNAVFSRSIKRKSLLFSVLSYVQRYGYRYSDHVITVSEDMKDTLIMDGTKSEKIKVIYNWSYTDELYDNLDTSQVSHMINPEYFNVVYAGNIGIMQNVDILIETADLLRNDNSIKFHIIGNGVYKEKLENRTNELGLNNICFWPMQSPELAPFIYSAADINVIPLVKDVYRTALPSKTATCLACKKPIIFPIGKQTKLQNDLLDTGCYFTDSDNPYELKDKILEIKNNNITFINSANTFSKLFSISKNSSMYSEIITTNIHNKN